MTERDSSSFLWPPYRDAKVITIRLGSVCLTVAMKITVIPNHSQPTRAQHRRTK